MNLNFRPTSLGQAAVSWQSMNDLSAHPAPRGTPTTNSVILNTLGDLTNRENRWAYQRFADDFLNLAAAATPDGLTDDFNGDNVPDYYPTLYPSILDVRNQTTAQLIFYPAGGPAGVWPPPYMGAMAFPYVFPGAYSAPQQEPGRWWNGWIHSPNPTAVSLNPSNPYGVNFQDSPLEYLRSLNHNPIDLGDNLPVPPSLFDPTGPVFRQTWWGFPTWRETLSPVWNDPTWQVNTNLSQPFALGYQRADAAIVNGPQLLPAMSAPYRNTDQPYPDGAGLGTALFPLNNNNNPPTPALWNVSWEDDLIMTGVRSFDIKALDTSLGGYADLGWGDDVRLTSSLVLSLNPVVVGPGLGTGTGNVIPYVEGNLDALSVAYIAPAFANVNGTLFDLLNQTFAHEGRMPPLPNDNRYDAQFGRVPPGTYAGFPGYDGNVGDFNPILFRLRRVWDSWSTEYTRAPATGVNLGTGFPAGPPFSPPIYPSYPAPYPAPLRGIQIQIRVTDPTNQRIKTLTIRQDFTDKL
jgi:hypothetical protein